MLRKKVLIMNSIRTRIAIGLAVISFVILTISWAAARSQDNIPGWSPVNAAMQETLASLNTDSSQVSAGLPAATPKAAESPLPIEQTVPPSTATLSATPSPSEPPNATQTSPPSEPLNPTHTPGTNDSRLDLNEATLSQLESLPGIGPSKAKAILDYRELHGRYRSVDELLEVKGIGSKMLEKLKPEVYVP
jgi:competence protein ComEA